MKRSWLIGLGVAAVMLTPTLGPENPAEPIATLATRDTPLVTAPAPVPGPPPWPSLDARRLRLNASAFLVVDDQGNRIAGKAVDSVRPIASVTKLMTAMVVLDARLDLEEVIPLDSEDRDRLRNSRSRLRIENARLNRRDLLLIALMSSENRAAAALGRTSFAGGLPAFVQAMNRKAQELGMYQSRFADATGLDAGNVSSAEDLVRMARAAMAYPLIREATTSQNAQVYPYPSGRALAYTNTNRLIASERWQIELSKTGYINEAGHCLVMRAVIADRPLYVVLLDAPGKLGPFGDSNRLRDWIQASLRSDNRQRG